ncbi:MAG: ABC transporter ATP-binding protein [Lautropia sp.]|nr:ABC transporter ATP-binding protein [Lautropia sp.]
MSNDTLLSIESLSFGYTPERQILKNISMRFRRGSVVALMGGSGSGKTTVLRLVGAQIRPQNGKVILNGVDVHSLGKDELYKARRDIGMLFQFGALFTDLDIFDNVAFPLREQTDLPESMIRDLVLMKLNAVGLRGAAHLMPSEISGGMARRVALARSIALDPPLLMYDEPFAGLDPISLGTIAHLIRTLNDALGATSILVTHDVQETFEIVDYAYVMSGGQIIAEGTPEELRASTDPQVVQFLNGRRDGPVAFQYPARPIREDLGL